MYVNLTVRNDTGRLNTSPVTTMTPIVHLKWGCNHTINIPGMYNPPFSTPVNHLGRCIQKKNVDSETQRLAQNAMGPILV